jgi:sialic acid synthase SpsE
MNVILNNQELDYSKVHIVLEAGPTHTGIETAKALVDQAVLAGADSIKFQTVDTDRLMADKSVKFDYSYLTVDQNNKDQFIPVEESLYEILKRRELTKNEWKDLKRYCDEKKMHMFTTACFEDEVDFLVDELKIDSIKVNSSDINQIGLIKHIAQKGVNIQIDTGSSDLWEIEKAVIAIEEEGNENIIIHHCPSGYPARLESIHLNMIPTLKKMFPKYLIAFSDHSPGWEMDIAAVSLGAGMVEKTITLDRYTKSCEHSFSLEGNNINKFISSIKELETSLGMMRRILPKEVRANRIKTRRSPYALKDLSVGDVINLNDFEFKRPGFGITYDQFMSLVGTKITQKLKKGQPLKIIKNGK